QAGKAQQSMQSAARALRQASRRLATGPQQGQPNTPGAPATVGAASSGMPDASLFSPEMQRYAGKTWGELPGELRTQIVQDMRAKYGEDYARMIKLYFEQLADTKREGK